jgi:hypothetical protein
MILGFLNIERFMFILVVIGFSMTTGVLDVTKLKFLRLEV